MVATPQSVHYAITNLASATPPGAPDPSAFRQRRLVADVHRWTAGGVGFIQLREKALDVDEIFALASSAAEALQAVRSELRPQLLVNARPDIAIAAGADGVHLTSRPGELRPDQVRTLFRLAGVDRCTITVSCHTLDEVHAAREQHADFVLFSPVFGKVVDQTTVALGTGLLQLRAACLAAGSTPVLALGGVSLADQRACLAAGAAGIAGIRLFASL